MNLLSFNCTLRVQASSFSFDPQLLYSKEDHKTFIPQSAQEERLSRTQVGNFPFFPLCGKTFAHQKSTLGTIHYCYTISATSECPVHHRTSPRSFILKLLGCFNQMIDTFRKEHLEREMFYLVEMSCNYLFNKREMLLITSS